MKATGTVYLVGAGPGDIGLLTLRGAELLGRADVVVYDALVNRDLLRLAPAAAEFVYGGKRDKEHTLPQEELNSLLVTKAREGKCIVRLKGGDPYIFGRGAEEVEELAAAGIPFEVVPGVSSFVAAPAYAGIPLTHREHSSGFSVLTGHEDPDKPEPALDYGQIARAPGTKVFMMGTRRIRQIAAALLAEGMPASTPVAMVSWATTGRQKSIEGTLATIADRADKAQLPPPSVTVIGDVVRLRATLNFAEHRPLAGQRVVITRAADQAEELARPLRELGAEVIQIPVIKIAPPDDRQGVMDAMMGIGEYNWVVFTSANGVTQFFNYFFKAFDDVRAIGNIRFAAVGPATAAKLQALHLRVDVMPEEALGKKIAVAINRYESVENLKILLPRAAGANPDLPKALEELRGIVDDVAFYKTVPDTDDRTGAGQALAESGADWVVFTSGSTVENFHARFGLPKLLEKFPQMRLASIGPETTKALTALGLKPAVEAAQHTVPGLVTALRHAVKKHPVG
jgi:uroporphyrinogen III methyltransferase/synthase